MTRSLTTLPQRALQICQSAVRAREQVCERHSVCRLVDGAGDGVPGLYVDRYGSLVLAHLLGDGADTPAVESATTELLEQLAPMCRSVAGASSIYLRVHPRDARVNREREVRLVWGEAISEITVKDGVGSYLVRPSKSLYGGLYVDTRCVRQMLECSAAGKRVLNLFCFTGSLGIAAALGGAAEVAQIDSSPAVLEWAKENWKLNVAQAREGAVMRFMCDDCRHFLDREVARVQAGGKRTEIALIDPPSFGRGRTRTFSIKRDCAEIVEKVMRIMAPQGVVFLTTNYREISSKKLSEVARQSAHGAAWELAEVTPIRPDMADFRCVEEISPAMRGVVIRGG